MKTPSSFFQAFLGLSETFVSFLFVQFCSIALYIAMNPPGRSSRSSGLFMVAGFLIGLFMGMAFVFINIRRRSWFLLAGNIAGFVLIALIVLFLSIMGINGMDGGG